MPVEFNLGRDRESHFNSQCEKIEQSGWEPINDFEKIKVSISIPFFDPWINVNPHTGALYKKGADSIELLNASPVVIELSHFTFASYIYIPREPLKYALNRIEAGHLVAVYDYQ